MLIQSVGAYMRKYSMCKSKKAFYSIELRVQKAYYHAANHSSILMRRK